MSRRPKVSLLGGAADHDVRESVRFVAVVDKRVLPFQKVHQTAVVFGRDVDKPAAGLSACGVGQFERTVNSIRGVQVTFDFHPVSDQQGELGGDLEALCGEIYEGAQTGGPVAVHKTPSIDGDAKMLAWIGHGRPFFLIDQ
ncbi:MAG: hypothetical protein ABL960_04725 [Nitrospira sp.]